MDAFELLQKDHKKVSQLFKEVEAASGEAKKQIFSSLKTELDVHAEIEERIFYPALENKEEARDITLEAYEEHKVVKDLLAELDSGDAAQDEWDAKLTVLKENVEHHVEEEEGELFSKARRVLSKQEIEELGVEMEAEKTSQLGGADRPPSSSVDTGPEVRSAASEKSEDRETKGVLARLANLVGLGTGATTRKGGKKRREPSKARKSAASKKTVKKASAAASSSKTKGSKSSKKAARKSATKSTKATRARGASKKRGASEKRGATKKSAPRRSAKKSQGRMAKKRGR